MFYDQKARAEEFAISANSGSSGHAQAGEWAETTISLSNAGNLSDSVELSVSNLPAGWSHRFQHMTGSQIPDGSRLDLSKGETKTIKLLVQPSQGSAMGSTSVNVHAHSTESTVSAMTTASFIVDPGYQPAWVEQDPSFSCAPGNACDFEITLRNDGDGQDTFSLSTSPVLSQDGWTFGLKWDQSTMVTIPKDGTETIMVTANIPHDGTPVDRCQACEPFRQIRQAILRVQIRRVLTVAPDRCTVHLDRLHGLQCSRRCCNQRYSIRWVVDFSRRVNHSSVHNLEQCKSTRCIHVQF